MAGYTHVNLKQDEAGEMALFKRPVAPYIVPLEALINEAEETR